MLENLLQPWVEHVRPEWIDYNGHLSEAYYVLVFGHATDSVMAQLGMTLDFINESQTSLYTLEAHVRYLDQISEGAELEVKSTIIGVGTKTVWIWHELFSAGRLRATEEILMVHVDAVAAKASSLPEELAAKLRGFLIDPPPEAGRAISIRSWR